MTTLEVKAETLKTAEIALLAAQDQLLAAASSYQKAAQAAKIAQAEYAWWQAQEAQ
jgi:hypothetical protein